jgi:hypothetical protein
VTARFDGLEQAVYLDHLDDHSRHAAVGATGPLPGRGCRIESEPAASPIAIVGERYTAKRAGRARIACGASSSSSRRSSSIIRARRADATA